MVTENTNNEQLPKGTKAEIPVYTSEKLFGLKNEIIIKHEDNLYRLRITRNGKLIMNK